MAAKINEISSESSRQVTALSSGSSTTLEPIQALHIVSGVNWYRNFFILKTIFRLNLYLIGGGGSNFCGHVRLIFFILYRAWLGDRPLAHHKIDDFVKIVNVAYQILSISQF
jgi:hypothetical protein